MAIHSCSTLMGSAITEGYVISNIHMTRQAKQNKSFVLVEGESDVCFYKNIVNKESTIVTPMDSKKEVIQVINKINQLNMHGVIGIIDADFDRALGNDTYPDNVIVTDDHDIETMILHSDVFDRFKNEFGDDEKIREYEGRTKKDVYGQIIEYSTEIGKLRLISEQENFNLNFKAVPLDNLFNEELDFDIQDYIDQVLTISNKIGIKTNILDKYNKISIHCNEWQICRGHDLTRILTIFFSKRKCGKNLGQDKKAQYICVASVEQWLRGAYYAPLFFKTTMMFKMILQWESNNPNWKILSDIYCDNAA